MKAEKEKAYLEILRQHPYLIVRDEPLSEYTTFRIGGTADLFCETDSTEILLSVLRAADALDIPRILIGCGSNLLVDDNGFRGLIIKFRSNEEPQLNFPHLTVSAGITLWEMLEFAKQNSLSGLEFFAGIPGTLGGAVYMNAGAYGSSMSEVMHSATIINNKFEIEEVSPDYFRFAYRTSIIQKEPVIVTSVTVSVAKGDKQEIAAEYKRILSLRASKHPPKNMPCAGSYFKNLPPENPGEHRRPAGYFLEQAGAKILTCGDAHVFEKHANMIVNAGKAKSAEVLLLAEKMKKAVREKYDIELKPEVRFLDAEKGIYSS